jgi:uncharacterized iron-regulated protein
MPRPAVTVFCLLFPALLMSCATVARKNNSPYTHGELIETSTRRVIPKDELASILEPYSVIFVGEVHINPDHHAFQLEVLKALHKSGESLAVGMEMFPREAQPVLDRWVAGSLSEKEFIREAQWYTVWGFPFELYRDILLYVRANKIPLVGLSAPNPVIREVAKGGISSLDDVDRHSVAKDIQLDNEAHRRIIHEQFKEHPVTDDEFENFYEAQRTRDETMAETLALVFGKGPDAPDKILVLAGAGHMANRLGVPDAFARRVNRPYVVLIPVEAGDVDEVAEANAADYVRVSLPTPKHHHPMIGVMLNPEELKSGRMEVRKVVKGSAAEKMGLQPGDIMEKVNGIAVKTPKDIHDALLKSPDQRGHTLTISRDGKSMTMDFILDFGQ